MANDFRVSPRQDSGPAVPSVVSALATVVLTALVALLAEVGGGLILAAPAAVVLASGAVLFAVSASVRLEPIPVNKSRPRRRPKDSRL